MTSLAAAILFLSAAQVRNLNIVAQEAPHEMALRAQGIFLTESSAGTDRLHRDINSHGWFQLQRGTACLVAGYRDSCPISAHKLETDTTLNLHLGLAYIQYCQNNFPASEYRAIECFNAGVPNTQKMSDKKIKRLAKHGYIARVLNYMQLLRAIPVSHE